MPLGTPPGAVTLAPWARLAGSGAGAAPATAPPSMAAYRAAFSPSFAASPLSPGLLLAWRSRVHRASAIGADDVQVRTQEDPPHNG